jgi:hypothetical protein
MHQEMRAAYAGTNKKSVDGQVCFSLHVRVFDSAHPTKVALEDQNQEAIALISRRVKAYDDAEADVLRRRGENLAEQRRQARAERRAAGNENSSSSESESDDDDDKPDPKLFDHTILRSEVRRRRLISDEIETKFGGGRKSYENFDTKLRDYFDRFFPEEAVGDKVIRVSASWRTFSNLVLTNLADPCV